MQNLNTLTHTYYHTQHLNTTPERFAWATSVLEVEANDRFLEIGCGAGLLAELVAERLHDGSIVAVDKSVAMIRMAVKRNQKYIDSGTASFIASDFAKTEFKKESFDKIFGFNVNFFWKKPEKELALIREYLKPNGSLFIFYQYPFGTDLNAAGPIIEKLEANNYEVKETTLKKLGPTSAFCITAKVIQKGNFVN